jgi:hypothetical protein
MEPVDVSGGGVSACWRDCQASGQINSDLMVLKSLSTMELS